MPRSHTHRPSGATTRQTSCFPSSSTTLKSSTHARQTPYTCSVVDYTLSTQDCPKKLFQGVYEDKTFKIAIKAVSYIHIKIILIILIQACHHILIQIFHHTLFFSLTYCISLAIYEPYEVAHHPHIPYLGYLYRPPPSIILSSTSPNLLPPYLCPCSSRGVTEHRRKRINPCSDLMNRNRRYTKRSREYQEYRLYHKYQSVHENMRLLPTRDIHFSTHTLI